MTTAAVKETRVYLVDEFNALIRRVERAEHERDAAINLCEVYKHRCLAAVKRNDQLASDLEALRRKRREKGSST